MTPRALSAAILTTLVAVVPLTHQAFIPAARVIDQPLDDTVVDVPVMTELTHPITLQDALSFISTARLSSEVEGFRFESDTVVGEYWMTDNLSPEAFLRAFDEDTGTAPQVVGLLSLESVRLSEAVDVKAPGTIAVAAEEYLAPAAKMPVDVVATLSDSAPRSESLQSGQVVRDC
jgi:hypothetical protein